MLFNMFVDSIIRHRVMVMAETKEGTEGIDMLIHDLVAYFYAKNGLVESTQPEKLQRAFGILTDLFVQVSLWTNNSNIISMACQTCHVPGRMSVEAYDRQK